MKPIIYFIRHGQTDWNADERFQGQKDIPINETGRGQAGRNGRALLDLLQQPSTCDFVASPLSRTRETMEIVRAELGLDRQEYRTDNRLVELNYGDWEGSTTTELRQAYSDLFKTRKRNKWEFVPPGDEAESYAMQEKRFAPWLDSVDHPTVCVTHGGILRCVWKIAGRISGEEAGKLSIPQDRILRLQDGQLSWL